MLSVSFSTTFCEGRHANSSSVLSNTVRSSFAQKNVSIVLDTNTHGEQDDYAVSPIIARLPLRSPSAFSLRAKLHNRALRGEYLLGWLFSARAVNKLPVRRTGLHAQDRSDSRPRQVNNSPDARIKANFLGKSKICLNQIKMSFVVCSKRFGTRAICKSQTNFSAQLHPPRRFHAGSWARARG